MYGFHANLAPDGSQIVYSSCQFPTELEQGQRTFTEKQGEAWTERDRLGREWDQRDKIHYEIAVTNIDGTNQHRLTHNRRIDNFPVWSPDGDNIAFVAKKYDGSSVYFEDLQLYTMAADGSDIQLVASHPNGVALSPPTWSPDGRQLAFIANDGEHLPFTKILYTVSVDGTDLTRIGETTTLGSWTADSQEVTYAAMEDQEAVIYAAKPDGTDRRELWRSGLDDEGEVEEGTPVIQVSWSPDGSELMFIYDWLYVIEEGAEEPRSVVEMHLYWTPLAAWSPDGSKIAIYYPEGSLFTLTRDGADQHFIGASNEQGGFNVHRPPPTPPPVDIGACSAGVVVPQPEANPGLVQDCEVLLGMRNTLVRHGPLIINWNEETPLSEWAGVVIAGSPPRVHELELWRGGLKGSLPPEIGQLTELRVIDIRGGSGVDANELQGPLPKELGDLTNLDKLVIGRHALSGPIPPELGKLKNLTWLNLYGNHLSGSIPPELAQMESLKGLFLTLNNLRGNIPVELGQLQELNYLRLDGNEFSGSIPVELAELVRLRTLYLNDNNLGGEIPVELAQMQYLDDLKLEGNDFSGCIAKEFAELWLEASWLPRCEPKATPTPQATPTP